MENILVAITNAPAIHPITTSLLKRDYWTAASLIFVTTASITSHLAENHKHGMPGIGFSQNFSYYLNRMDVAGCIMLGLRLGYCYYRKYGFNLGPIYRTPYLLGFGVAAMFLLRISEYDKYNTQLKYFYMLTHCSWHLTIFPLINYFLEKVIY